MVKSRLLVAILAVSFTHSGLYAAAAAGSTNPLYRGGAPKALGRQASSRNVTLPPPSYDAIEDGGLEDDSDDASTSTALVSQGVSRNISASRPAVSPSQASANGLPDWVPVAQEKTAAAANDTLMALQEIQDDSYAVFGLSADADAAAVKKVFQRLALRYHPDKAPGAQVKPIYNDIFALINSAKEEFLVSLENDSEEPADDWQPAPASGTKVSRAAALARSKGLRINVGAPVYSSNSKNNAAINDSLNALETGEPRVDIAMSGYIGKYYLGSVLDSPDQIPAVIAAMQKEFLQPKRDLVGLKSDKDALGVYINALTLCQTKVRDSLARGFTGAMSTNFTNLLKAFTDAKVQVDAAAVKAAKPGIMSKMFGVGKSKPAVAPAATPATAPAAAKPGLMSKIKGFFGAKKPAAAPAAAAAA